MIDDLRLLSGAQTPDIISLCETWLDDSIASDELAIDGYSLIHRDRNRHGGGIAICTRDCIQTAVALCHPIIEFLLINLKFKRKNIMLGLLCRPPRDDLSVLSALESILEELSPAPLESLVILGDFNIDLSPSKITSAGSKSRQLGSMSDKFGLKQFVFLPTRVSKYSCSIHY